ncbi:MAG TPA: TetR/AcrR family transcriptional regulator [Thermoanaerobaculia bacterium]|nr:TetR/AcrR family transcriptional regulator [Thermoanaerobaculia bacterium]
MPTSTRPSAAPARADRDPGKAVEICVAAARIFSEKGFHATSINEVADAVHLTKAGLYYYIKGKQDLLFRIMELAMDTLEQEVVAKALLEEDLVARLRTIIARYTRLIIAGRNELSILVNEIEGLSEAQRAQIVGRQREFMRFIRETLDELAAEGKLNDVDSTVGAYGLSGMILWVSRWYRSRGRLDVDQLVDHVTRIALTGLLEEGCGRTKPARPTRKKSSTEKKPSTKKAPS